MIQPHAPDPLHQYLSFQIQDGTYALDIESILEIRAIGSVTPLPGAPIFVRGIMNLRGALVPVIDLRLRLGLPQAAVLSRFAVTIITKLDNKIIGLVADGVNEVLNISKSSQQTSNSLLDRGDQGFIRALALLPAGKDSQNDATGSSTVVALLNLDRLYDPALDNANLSSAASTDSEVTDVLANLHQSLTAQNHTDISSPTETKA